LYNEEVRTRVKRVLDKYKDPKTQQLYEKLVDLTRK
jgi:hypothetical protein